MNKFYFLALFVVTGTLSGVLSDAPEAVGFINIVQKCRQKTDATEQAYEMLLRLNSSIDDSSEGKCFLQCVLEESKMMNTDGSINNNVVKSFINRTLVADLDSIYSLWTACHERVERMSDKCQYSYNILRCFFSDAEKKGPERIQWASRIMDQCRKYANTTQVDVITLVDLRRVSISYREPKCFLKCAMENLGVMAADGTIHRPKIRFLIYNVFNINVISKVEDIWVNCENKEPKDDRCSFTIGVLRCFVTTLEGTVSRSGKH